MNKKYLIIAGVALFLLLTAWVVLNTNEINKEIEQDVVKKGHNITETARAKSLHIVETEEGKKVWELTADNAIYSSKNASLTNVKGKFFDENDKVLLTFKAPVGSYVEAKHQLSLDKGALVLHPDKNISIASKTMSWSNNSKDIIAEGKVKIVKQGFGTSYGDKTTFSVDFSKISIEGNTYSEIDFSG